MDDSPGLVDLLSSRVEGLERRVYALEHPDEAEARAVKPTITQPHVPIRDAEPPLQTANVFPLLGRAMLGIGGAYVLRAVAEAGMMPKIVVAALAVAYAFAWLVSAALVSRTAGIAQIVYAGTSAVILVPMLWEETLHFKAFPASVSASVLAAFAGLASGLLRRREPSRMLWMVYGAAAGTAIALSVSARAMLPFVLVLLLIVLLDESARILGHARPMWPLMAIITDALIWGMIFIYSGPPGARAEYPELSFPALVLPACLLFAIQASSMAVRTVLQEKKIGIFEIVQVMIAFGLSILSLFSFASRPGMTVGIACAVLSAAAYFASFGLLRSRTEIRNFVAFSLWSAALLVGGALWSLPHVSASVLLACAGLAAYAVGSRTNSTMLEWHGAAFLCVAAAIGGVATHVTRVLASSFTDRPELAVWIVAGTAVASCAAAGNDIQDETWVHHFPRMVPALLAVATTSALLVDGAVTFAMLVVPVGEHHIAFLGTLIAFAVSLMLAYAGPRLGRIALTRMAYVSLAFMLAKLLFQDLRQGSMALIASSFFLFAAALIAVPRLVRMGSRMRADAHAKAPVLIRG